MAIALQADTTNQEQITLGFNPLASDTAFTIALTVNASSISDDERIIQAWSNTTGNNNWIIQAVGAGPSFEIGLAAFTSSTRGSKSGAGIFSTGLQRIVVSWTGSAQPDFYVNGTASGGVTWIAGGMQSIATLQNNSANGQVGYDSNSPKAGVDGDYSELAICSGTKASAAQCLAYSNGAHPLIAFGGIITDYWPFFSTSSIKPRIGGSTTGVSGGAANAEHPLFAIGGPTRTYSIPAAGGATIPIFHRHYANMRAA